MMTKTLNETDLGQIATPTMTATMNPAMSAGRQNLSNKRTAEQRCG
jgi:hypothetical protein